MSKSSLSSALLLSVLLHALPSLADYAPLRIGNTWTYRGSVRTDTFNPSGIIAFQEYLEVAVVSQDGEPGEGREVLWTVELRDSLYNRQMPDPRTGLSVALADTVVVLRQMLKEAGGLISHVPGAPPNLPAPYFHPIFVSTLHAGSLFQSRQAPPNSTPVPGASGGHTVMELAPYGPASPERTWFVDGVGLFWLERSGIGADCSRMKRILVLDSFNGRPVDIGIPTPSSPLAKETKINCTAIRRSGMGAPVLRPGGRSDFDLRGRRLMGVDGSPGVSIPGR